VGRILLIEDDQGAQLLYRNRLTDLGHEVVVASSGGMGLMEARMGAFDLFLVDIGLGSGIDGYEVCRRLRTIPKILGVPVVLISGQVKTQEDLHKGYEAGCQSFLVKGDHMLLEDVVRAMLRIKSLQDDLALQNRLLEEQNRRLQFEKERTDELERAHAEPGTALQREPSRPDAVLLVEDDGVVRRCDRGARDLFGQSIEGKHLASLAPDSRLEAVVRNARTEPHEGLRFDIPERPGRPSRAIVASVHPMVPLQERAEPSLRVVFLHEGARRRVGSELDRSLPEGMTWTEWGPLVEAARACFQPAALLGDSEPIARARAALGRLATSEEPVLLRGPGGSGKEFAARILHYSGERRGPFLSLRCGALNRASLESELFGQAAGTNHRDAPERAGLLRLARRGTLFLQDVELLPLDLQERLVQVLEPSGPHSAASRENLHVDARILAGTRTPLEDAVRSGAFRADLYRLLSRGSVLLPGLKERGQDFDLLADHFLARFRRRAGLHFSAETRELLRRHDWSDNVRELIDAVQRICLAAKGEVVTPADLSPAFGDPRRRPLDPAPTAPVRGAPSGPPEPGPSGFDDVEPGVSLLDAYEKKALLHSLHRTGGDKLAAARLLGVGKSTFYRKLKLHGIS